MPEEPDVSPEELEILDRVWHKRIEHLIGITVRMTDAYKQELIANGCSKHVEEFGDCEGIVEGFVDYGSCSGPELNVRWKPSMLRYGYHPSQLAVVV